MVYVTVKAPPMYKQMSVEELLFGGLTGSVILNDNSGNTRTNVYERLPASIQQRVNVNRLINKLEAFNAETSELRNRKDRKSLYTEFYRPKRSGHGYRRIDAPVPELMEALRKLKLIFENDFGALYHTSAFAYIKGRCTIDAVERHRANESRWFEKDDLSNFFGSTTPDFVLRMFSMIFPFSEVVKTERGKNALCTALDLAFLDGGLPQGTPISPIITNVMMIPIDFKLTNTFRNFNGQYFVYTRYADDFITSSKYDFKPTEIRKFINDTFTEFGAPFALNPEKSRYGSSSGSNYNLGVILNRDNNITIGNKRKREFQAALANYVMDRRNGNPWTLEDVRILDGHRNYYRMVEKETIDKIIAHLGEKFKVDIVQLIKEDLKA